MKSKYYSVEEMIPMIDEPSRSACTKLCSDNQELFEKAPGSGHNHQAWEGGYMSHVQECMNIAIVFYKEMNDLRPLPFSLSDALLVLFLHDLEKPWKYNDSNAALITKESRKMFRTKKIAEYDIALTPEQENGLRYVEGEGEDYSGQGRVMGSLAAFCHLADVVSARIWFDHPMEQNDPWMGAKRVRD